jgi:thymidine phosphorylase
MTDGTGIKDAASLAHGNPLTARRLGIDTQDESVIFLRKDSDICRSEGFTSHARVRVTQGDRSIIATLFQVTSNLLHHFEAGLSEAAWSRLGLTEGAHVWVSHLPPLDSLSILRSKVYGHRLGAAALRSVISDVAGGLYSGIELSSLVTVCSARPLDLHEIVGLTRAMVDVGDRLTWDCSPVLDKHSVGGLPGNRTTPIVVAIVAACGLTIPKTSSRAITSPAGTADVMETLTKVDIDVPHMRRVVEAEGGCLVWGGAARLSPADDILIRVERVLDLDSEGQLIASVLSKKIAAGASHVVLDLPVGPTAKVRSQDAADAVSRGLTDVAQTFGLKTVILRSDGTQPVGHGIGPALEARDVLAVLTGKPDAPADLRERALVLAGAALELGNAARTGEGAAVARSVLTDGRAWAKFQRICEAQGGLREPPVAPQTRPILSPRGGHIAAIDNRKLARLAKLAGAPDAKSAGISLHVRLGDSVLAGEPLCTLHAESLGELDYALAFATAIPDIITVSTP